MGGDPRLEQRFSFESSVVRLADGNFFQPLREAKASFAIETPAGYRLSGSHYEVLYECKDRRFILLQFTGMPPRRGLWQSKVVECNNDITGGEVDSQSALDFLIEAQLPIPEQLQILLLRQHQVEIKVAPEVRPLEFWVKHAPNQTGKLPAHQCKVVDLLTILRDDSISAVHEIRSWTTLDSDSRSHKRTVILLYRLNEQYLVDPLYWWGAKNKVPPEFIGLNNLRWPAGIDDLKNRVLPELIRLLIPAATVLYCRMPISHSNLLPTDTEIGMAETELIQNCSAIEELVGSLITTLTDVSTGKTFEELPVKGPVTIRKPKDWEMRAFLIHKQRGLTYSQIRDELKLGKDATTIGRGIKRVSDWLGQGNVLPPNESSKPIIIMDSKKLDLGSRPPGRRRKKLED